jgi:uncharacterized phage protein (TIGR02216 family)
MHVGLGLLRLSPHDFWAMTPREFLAATGLGRAGSGALRRTDLAGLMALFPDRKQETTWRKT